MILVHVFYSLKYVYDLSECVNDANVDQFELGMIGGIGDSVLAGYGSREHFSWPFFNPMNFREDRGATLVSGGDDDMTSMIKMAKVFNPNVKGESTGTHWLNLCRGKLCFWPFNAYHKSDGLNVAETGAFLSDTMRQAKELVKRVNALINEDPSLAKKWKLIVFMVGLNDQFNNCNRYQSTLPYFDYYSREIMNYLRENLEFVIIDVISIWNLDEMVELSSRHPSCMHSNRQQLFKTMCSCPFGKNGKEFRKNMKAFQLGQNAILRNIVSDYQSGKAWSKKEKSVKGWKGKPSNFKLIYDPSAEETNLSNLHPLTLTKLDCSHPTKQMHERLANIYWNNLFLKSSEKMRNQEAILKGGFLNFTCPEAIKFD